MSKSVELPFRTFRHRTLGVLRSPVIPAVIRGPGGILRGDFVLDSGSDLSMIPYSVGARIGLRTDGAPVGQCRGVSEGRITYYVCTAEFQIGSFWLPARVGWTTVEGTPLILGRLDIFDALDIEFQQGVNRITLRPSLHRA